MIDRSKADDVSYQHQPNLSTVRVSPVRCLHEESLTCTKVHHRCHSKGHHGKDAETKRISVSKVTKRLSIEVQRGRNR